MSTDRSRRADTDDATLDAHARLGTTPDASDRDLRRAYRRALLRAHPDQGGDRAELELVQAAFDLLSSRRAVRPLRPSVTVAVGDDRSRSPEPDAVAPDLLGATVESRMATVPGDEPPAHGLGSAPEPRRAPAHRVAAGAYRIALTLEQAADTESTPASARAAKPARRGFAAILDRELVRRSGRRVRLVGPSA